MVVGVQKQNDPLYAFSLPIGLTFSFLFEKFSPLGLSAGYLFIQFTCVDGVETRVC